MQLSIIVLSYNKSALVLECLTCLFSQFETQIKDKTFEIILVDNNSSEDVVGAVKDLKKDHIKIIANKENVGFGKGNNIGAKSAKGKYILFLNSDTKVLDKGFVSMIEYLDTHDRVGILGGKLKNSDGTWQASAGRFYSVLTTVLLLAGFERFGFLRSSPSKITRVDWVSGACMMLEKSFFEKLNGFDEKIFMYLEDMELCFRAKKEKKDTYFFPDVSVQHLHQGSSNRTFAIVHIYEGLLYFFNKHKSKTDYQFVKMTLVMKAKIAIMIGKIFGKKYLTETYTQALAVV